MISIKNKILAALALVLTYILLGALTYGSHSWMLFLTLTTCFIISFFILRNNNRVNALKLIVILTTPLLLIFILLVLLYQQYSRTILYIIFIPVSSIMAYMFYKFKNILILLFSISLFATVGFVFFENVFSFIENKDAETNISFPNVTFTDNNKTPINLSQDKVVVLDFWSTSCGICFAKFPDFEATYLKYKNNPNVIIYTVNVPLKKDDFKKTTRMLNNLGYTFPKLYATSAKQVKDSLNINSFPHLLIIKNGKIRYNGILETGKKVVIYNIESEIEKLLNEKK